VGMRSCRLQEISQYEEETFDYLQLSVLLRRMAKFYDCIIKQLRSEPKYFRVVHFGRRHPPYFDQVSDQEY